MFNLKSLLFGNTNPMQQGSLLGQPSDRSDALRKAFWAELSGIGAGLLNQQPSLHKIGIGDTLVAGMQGGMAGLDKGMEDYKKEYGFNQELQAKRAADQEAAAQKARRDQYMQSLPPGVRQAINASPGLLDDYIKSSNPAFQKPEQTAQNEYGLNPVITQNPQTGEYMLLQPSRNGGPPQQMKLPDGYNYAPPNRSLDLGPNYGTVPTRGTGQIGGLIPKDLAGAESQKAQGEASGKARAAAPSDIVAAENAMAIVDSIKSDPNIDWGTGLSSVFNSIPGSPGKDFQTKVTQATSGAFKTAIQEMRGLGSLSNAEGQVATAAVTRMSTATSKEAFLAALDDYRTYVELAKLRAEARLNGSGQQGGGADDPLGLRGP